MKVYCPALLSGKYIPARCTSTRMPGGMNISPPVAWGDVPGAAQSFVLTMVDQYNELDPFAHWVVVNIPRYVRDVPEKSSRIRGRMPDGVLELRNSNGETGYAGPYLPPGGGLHEYRITVYAIRDEKVEFGPLSLLGDVLSEIPGRVLDAGSFTALLRQ